MVNTGIVDAERLDLHSHALSIGRTSMGTRDNYLYTQV